VRASIGAGLNLLAVLLLLNSVLAAYYYLKVMVYMYMREPMPGAPVAKPMKSGYVTAALILSAVAVLLLGIWPTSSLQLAIDAAIAML